MAASCTVPPHASSPCALFALLPPPRCRFRVRAENEAGRSLWSPLGEGRTAAVAPSACGAPTVLGVSKTSLTVRWEVRQRHWLLAGLQSPTLFLAGLHPSAALGVTAQSPAALPPAARRALRMTAAPQWPASRCSCALAAPLRGAAFLTLMSGSSSTMWVGHWEEEWRRLAGGTSLFLSQPSPASPAQVLERLSCAQLWLLLPVYAAGPRAGLHHWRAAAGLLLHGTCGSCQPCGNWHSQRGHHPADLAQHTRY